MRRKKGKGTYASIIDELPTYISKIGTLCQQALVRGQEALRVVLSDDERHDWRGEVGEEARPRGLLRGSVVTVLYGIVRFWSSREVAVLGHFDVVAWLSRRSIVNDDGVGVILGHGERFGVENVQLQMPKELEQRVTWNELDWPS